jgi:class 3 adenylate cyclase/tRNA A-37 threonylcarbamoyl transferase component Bud32
MANSELSGASDLDPFEEKFGPAPERLGPYVIEARLGSGGMGAVYRARDERLDRLVAIKYIRAQDYDSDDLRQRFQREARAAAQLNHPSIVQIFDFVQEEECDWIVMEHAGGRTLRKILKEKGHLELARGLPVLREIAHGLAEAHRLDVVHRDIKTDNVIVTDLGRVKILDFGVARRILADQPQDRTLTLDGMIIGTPHAMSPEQANGRTVDHRTDLFSFATLSYELLTGACPFEASNPIKVLFRICTHHPPPVHKVKNAIPKELGELIERMMAKDPADRPVDAREVAKDLDRMVGLEISGYFALDLDLKMPRGKVEDTTDEAPTAIAKSPATRPERIQVSLLAGEIAGQAALDPEALFDARPALFDLVETIVERFGGRLLERSDSDFLAIFGCPGATEDDARRAVAAGRELLRRLALVSSMQLRLGVHTGPAVIGRHHGIDDVALAATGHTAATLYRDTQLHGKNQAPQNHLVLSEETFQLVRSFFETERIQEFPKAHRCLGLRDPQRVDEGPFPGRRKEFEILRMAWRWVSLGRGQVVLITGEAGVGKSRLVGGFLQETAIEVLSGQALPETKKNPLAPLCALLHKHLGVDLRLEALEGFLTDLSLPLSRFVPALAPLLGVELKAPYQALETSDRRQEAIEAMLAILVEMARKTPRLVLLENLQQADATTREFLDLLITRAARLPIMIILTCRPGFKTPWSGQHVTSFPLDPLERPEVEEIVDALVGERTLTPEVRERILLCSQGNPRIVEELTQAWLLHPPEGEVKWCPANVAPALYGSLRARFDELAPEVRELAGLAAVLCPLLTWDLVSSVAELDGKELRAGFDQLVDAGILERHGSATRLRYTFRQPLIRDAAYGIPLKKRRRELHGRVAELLAERFAGLAAEHQEIVAYHRRRATCP